MIIRSHEPRCPTLKRIVARERQGICSQCGTQKERSVRWDAAMQAVVRVERCPQGHSSGQTWMKPEDATASERAALGLRKKR